MLILNLTNHSLTCPPSRVRRQFKLLERWRKVILSKKKYGHIGQTWLCSFCHSLFSITIKQHKTVQCKTLLMEHRFLHINCLVLGNSEIKIIS